MCKRSSPDLKKKKKKKEASTGCVRETPHRKMKSARDMKFPREKKKKKEEEEYGIRKFYSIRP